MSDREYQKQYETYAKLMKRVDDYAEWGATDEEWRDLREGVEKALEENRIDGGHYDDLLDAMDDAGFNSFSEVLTYV